MRYALALAAALLLAAPLAAQFEPEFRDLDEASRGLNAFQRQLVPALKAVDQESRTLNAIVKAWRQLEDNQPRFAIDESMKTLDEFVEREETNGTPLPKELLRYVNLAKAAIEKAKVTASSADIFGAREYIHHDVIHPMQQSALTNVQRLMAFAQAVQRTSEIAGRTLGSALGAAQSAAKK